MTKLIFTSLFLIASLLEANIYPVWSNPLPSPSRIDQEETPTDLEIKQKVQQIAKNITVRIMSENNGGSGVLIAQKGDTYLILTNAHVVRKAAQIQVQAPDGNKYAARRVDGGFSSKYDLALLQIDSKSKYQLPDLSDLSELKVNEIDIYTTGYPFDSNDLRIMSGKISQLSDIPFDDGTQIGYTTDKGGKSIRQGMSGGPIFDASRHLLGINTVGVAPILPDYRYNDGSKPIAKLQDLYARANWGIPVYNFLTNVKAEILYGYDNLPKVKHQVTPTGFMAERNQAARKMTVRIENRDNHNKDSNGSGVIVAREGRTYYVLTAKHVVQDEKGDIPTHQKFTDGKVITYDQDSHPVTGTVVAESVDLAVIKFSSSNDYSKSVAKLGEYSPNDNDLAFVGGFPGRLNIKSPLWQWQLNPGFIFSKEAGKLYTQNDQSFSEGYNLIYSSISYRGMSGGPVFDTKGNVIGIHGRAELADLNSLGISVKTFIELAKAKKLEITPNLFNLVKIDKNYPGVLKEQDQKNVIKAMQNLTEPPQGAEEKRWLDYANQLYRTHQYDNSADAFDKAIDRSKQFILEGNYGKALALGWAGRSLSFLDGRKKMELASIAIAKAIDAVPSEKTEQANYYYLWKYQAFILWDLGDSDGALRSIDTAINLKSNDQTLQYHKAGILQNKKEYKKAINIYNAIISKQPEASYAYYNRGTAKLNLRENKEAIVDLDRAVALGFQNFFCYQNQGVVNNRLRRYQEAIVSYDKAIALDPSRSYMYNNRGNAKSNSGQKQAAIDDYTLAIAINPKDADAYNNRGNVKSSLGQKQAAIDDYTQAIVINPKDDDTYNNRGNAKYNSGQKQAAVDDYTQAIIINPKQLYAYKNRGIAKSDLGQKQAAIDDYTQAITINPKDDVTYNNRGNAKSDLGQKQAAIDDYTQAITINPKQPYAYTNRGNVKYNLGQKQAAIDDYTQAIIINYKDADAYINRGNTKFELGDNVGAMKDTDRAIVLNPNSAVAYSNRGSFTIVDGKEREALPDLERAIKLDPKMSYGYANRGIVRETLGDKQGAISDYKQAVRLNPKIIAEWKKQAESVSKYNQVSYQKYQQMIQKLEAGSKAN
jgi:tetratricopeptide (TPR) repeat protein/S1-C subfamily serine protease